MAGKKKAGDRIASIKFNGNLHDMLLGSDGRHITRGVKAPHELNTNPNDVWFDVENCALPKDVQPREMYNLIVQGLKKRNYHGPVRVRMVFAKTNEHITLDCLAKMRNIEQRDLGICDVIPEKNTADNAIIEEIRNHVADPLNHPPRNIFVMSGDTFFVEDFMDLQKKNYRLLGCFRPGSCKEELLNSAVSDSWLHRDLLDLPYDEIKKKVSKKRKSGADEEQFVQEYSMVPAETTLPVLIHFLKQEMESKIMVHFFTCSTAEYVATVLREVDVPCREIHGKRLLEENIQAYEEFKTAKKKG